MNNLLAEKTMLAGQLQCEQLNNIYSLIKMTYFILPENDLLENATALKTFEYSRLGSELKKQTSFSEKQYQGLNKLFRSDEEEE